MEDELYFVSQPPETAAVNRQPTAGRQPAAFESRLRIAIIVLVVCTDISLLFSVQMYLILSTIDPAAASWTRALRGSMSYWYSWALLVFPVVWTSRRFPLGRNNWFRHSMVHITGALLTASCHTVICATLYWLIDAETQTAATWMSALLSQAVYYFCWDLLIYMAIAGLEHAVRHYRESQTQQLHAVQLRSQLSQARLDALRMQLNPHFLFNSLNAIAELIHENPELADEMLTRLGALLRRILDERGDLTVPLHQELEFAEEYLQIEQTRFSDRLRVSIDLADPIEHFPVPSLILQPLIENAIKHGIAKDQGEGFIQISAFRRENTVCIQVINGCPDDPIANQLPERHGLTIVRQRLQERYGDLAYLDVETPTVGRFVATIHIPIENNVFREADAHPKSR